MSWMNENRCISHILVVTLLSAILLASTIETSAEDNNRNNPGDQNENESTRSSSAQIELYISEIQEDDPVDVVTEADWYYWVGFWEGEDIEWQTSNEPVEWDNGNPIIDRTYTYTITDRTWDEIDFYITLFDDDPFSEDPLAKDDLADLSENPSGGIDNVGEVEPDPGSFYTQSYHGILNLKTNELSGDKTESYGSYRITKGNYDGNSGDDNDANLVFSVSDNYEKPTADIVLNNNEIETSESISFDGSSSSASLGSVIEQYQWDFDGDGNYDASGVTTSHTYNIPGIYEAELKVTDDWGEIDTTTRTITVNNRDPVAEFSYSPTNPTTKDQIQFHDGSSDPDGEIESWEWSFDDGEISDEENPVHSFSDDGQYTVELIVTDNHGGTDTVTKKINVGNEPPEASFGFSPEKPKTFEEITFEDTSTDSDGTIVSYEWKFGTEGISSDNTAYYTFDDDGSYTVTLIVTDDDGDSGTCSKTVQVFNRAPNASFKFSPVNPSAGQSIQFEDTSSDMDGEISSRHWDFGDGDGSDNKDPIHQYTSPGDYNITLTVTDDDGATASISHITHIEERTDNVKPVVEVISPIDGEEIYSSDLVTEWSGSDDSGIDHYEIQLDDGAWISVGKNTSYLLTDLSNGSHTINVKAIDNADNQKVVTIQFVVILDEGGNGDDEEEEEDEEDEPQDDGKDNITESSKGDLVYYLLIIPLLIIVLIIVLFIMYSRKKKDQDEEPDVEDN